MSGKLNNACSDEVKSAEGILVFHAFAKTTQTTPQMEIDTAKKRLWEILNR